MGNNSFSKNVRELSKYIRYVRLHVPKYSTYVELIWMN